jgi:O-antigen/teichoic acid export membrane protein
MDGETMQAGAAAAAPGAGSRAVVARNAFHLVLGQVATTAIAIVLSAALGRSLGAGDFGIYYLITTVSVFGYVFVEWGQGLLVIREVARSPSRAGDLLGTALANRAAFALLVVVPSAVAARTLGSDSRVPWLAAALIVATLPQSMGTAVGMVFRGHDRMGRDAAVSVVNKALALCLVLPALKLGAGLPGVVAAQALAGVAALALAVRLLRPLAVGPLHVSRATSRELLAGGAPIVALTAAISAQPYLDAIILSRLVPHEAIGWFGAARNILGTLMAPAMILGNASYPRLARASAAPATLGHEVRAAMRPMLWLGALAGVGTYLFAHPVVELIFGARGFAPAGTILQVFAPGLFLLFLDILFGTVIYAIGSGTAFAVAKILSVALGAGLDFLLIPIFQSRTGNGGIGVMVSFAASEVVVFVGSMIALRRRRLLHWSAAADVARALASAGATLLAVFLLPPLPIWAGIPLCVALFAAASLATGLAGLRDVELVRALLRRGPAAADPGDRA